MNKAMILQPAIEVPGVDLEAYMRSVSTVPLLGEQEEKELAERLFYHEDVEAARRLVIAHLRFVVHIARSYKGYGLSQSDLIQEGNVGLMKAVKRFDPNRGVRLVSFAVHWIKAEIHEFVLRNWRIVKIATTKAQRKLFFNLRSAKKSLALLTQDEAKAIAGDLNVSVKEVLEMEGRLGAHDSAYDTPVDSAQDDENMYVPANYLQDSSVDPALLVEQEMDAGFAYDDLAAALKLLDERSRDILQQRWLNDEKVTLHDLAAKYGVSAERIRQLEKSAMKKLRSAINEDFLFEA